MEAFIFIVIILLMGLWASTVMSNKGRSPIGGFLLGAILGLLGVIIAYMFNASTEHQALEYKKMKDLIDKDN